MKIGYCFTGSFCTLSRSIACMAELINRGHKIVPIMSERVYTTDTRFALAEDLRREVEALSGEKIIHTVEAAEPLGPRLPLDLLVVAPCTGNTLSKLANGITDSAALMAIKAHLRSDRTVLIALASNDALSQSLAALARLLTRRAVYFVPMRQDDPKGKPHSLVADFDRLPDCVELAARGECMRPLFLPPAP
ncbi:MAG: dipicolinate synthase subunit B [Clostridia bacterium]|nr:dipicolinate synthase subunit B [Clostridia bacterium]